MKPKRGRPPKMSDSEVLTLAVAGQWRVGVPWRSERGLVRYIRKHYRMLFPEMLERSAFNQRVRYLWGVLVKLQQELADRLRTAQDIYECVDCLPLPAYQDGQHRQGRGHWLWTVTRGRGPYGWHFGNRLLAAVQPNGAVTGWLLSSAHVNDRWFLEALLSLRVGDGRLLGAPPMPPNLSRKNVPPGVPFTPPLAAGRWSPYPYLVDKGFGGLGWLQHWRDDFQATVISAPQVNSKLQRQWEPQERRWLSSHRQIVETAFSWLDDIFGIKQLQAHSHWGQLTRLAAKMAAYNLGLFINRMLNRPEGALATLLC